MAITLAYSFGNHMHWVDMEWLWGYDVLPGSTEDMLKYCRELGVKGNVNFDGIGYEKMAAESPEHLAMLREAIKEGIVEVVGASYGQPYGLFQGGESNVRQRIYGVRTAMRTLGTRPRTFWEEEFDFYPQLPQMLAGCGFTGASLYFQWTWHTPEIPFEDAPVVLWEGVDGTRIPTATRNRMNLHQWPEDFRILLDDLAANPPAESDVPALVLQWLELMPTQDWMCRSELMAPMLRELQQDPRFEIVATTLGEYLARYEGKDLPVRQYKLDDVWHGMTLGKNGDRHPKLSIELENKLRRSETIAAILGLFGRPYDPWDVYPTWELEELWRNLLAFQHHDNHECEGLCGDTATMHEGAIEYRLQNFEYPTKLARRVGLTHSERVLVNHLGFESFVDGEPVRAMGYRVVQETACASLPWRVEGSVAKFEKDSYSVEIDLESITIIEFSTPRGVLRNFPIRFVYQVDGQQRIADCLDKGFRYYADDQSLVITVGPESVAVLTLTPVLETEELSIGLSVEGIFEKMIDPGYAGSIRAKFPAFTNPAELYADSPYAVDRIGQGSSGRRKYPEGDWMTSPQFFEEVEHAFTSSSFVNVITEQGEGLLISHDGHQQWFRKEDGIENVVLSVDPWDGYIRPETGYGCYHLFPHRGISHAQCVKRAAQLGRVQDAWEGKAEVDPYSHRETSAFPMPRTFSAVTVHNDNVLATAFYREQASHAGRDLPNYAAKNILHPYILRLVEYNGESGEVEVTLPGPIANAYKTNLLGELIEELSVDKGDASHLTTETDKLQPFGIEAAKIKLHMRAHEIATIYLDIVPGRKQFRDLDAKREIWATVHRVEGE